MSSRNNLTQTDPPARKFLYFMKELDNKSLRQMEQALRSMDTSRLPNEMARHGVISIGRLAGTSRRVDAVLRGSRIWAVATPFKDGEDGLVESGELQAKGGVPGVVPFLLLLDWRQIQFSLDFNPPKGPKQPGQPDLSKVFERVMDELETAATAWDDQLDPEAVIRMSEEQRATFDKGEAKEMASRSFDEEKQSEWFDRLREAGYIN